MRHTSTPSSLFSHVHSNENSVVLTLLRITMAGKEGFHKDRPDPASVTNIYYGDHNDKRNSTKNTGFSASKGGKIKAKFDGTTVNVGGTHHTPNTSAIPEQHSSHEYLSSEAKRRKFADMPEQHSSHEYPRSEPRRKTFADLPKRIQLTGSICYFPKERISKQVFYGEQTTARSPRRIAVKTGFLDNAILRETKILLELAGHQNVVSYIDSGRYDPGVNMFLAMELCHSQNLRQYIEDRKSGGQPFDEKLAVRHAKHVVAGLRHIHDAGIIHRDLKPDNILFSLDQKYLKISDFGMSKQLEGQSTSFSFTGQVGTDGYKAPEVLNGGPVSKEADVFSLGLVLHYMWSYGEHPFGSDPLGGNFHIKMKINPDFSHLKLEPKTWVKNLLGCILQFKPNDRPSIEQIQDDRTLGGRSAAKPYLASGMHAVAILAGGMFISKYPGRDGSLLFRENVIAGARNFKVIKAGILAMRTDIQKTDKKRSGRINRPIAEQIKRDDKQ